MFTVSFSNQFKLRFDSIKDDCKETIKKKIKELENNPELKSKETNKPIFADYYMKAGNSYAIIYNIDFKNNNIELIGIHYKSFLHKILTNQISSN